MRDEEKAVACVSLDIRPTLSERVPSIALTAVTTIGLSDRGLSGLLHPSDAPR